MKGAVLALLLAALASGCVLDRNAHAQRLADAARLTRESVHTDSFTLTSFVRITESHAPLHVYIEGDGYAWRSPTEPSDDPTPRHALALQLAVRDDAANVVYLARPCQFTRADSHCEAAYWTAKRYAPEVIAAMNQAISNYARQVPDQPLHLIGYSGGAAVAILIAARRSDVATIRTLAGNLDVDEVMRLQGVPTLPESLNPINAAQSVALIPQIHFSGEADRIVPPAIAQRFAAAEGGNCVQTRTLSQMGHESDWASLWAQLLLDKPGCKLGHVIGR